MKKNSFSKVLMVTVMAACILGIVVMVNESISQKCIMSGCDNYRALESEYCYIHRPSARKYTSGGTSTYSRQSTGSSSGSSLGSSSSKSATSNSGSSSKSSAGSSSHSNKSTSGSKASPYQSYDEGYDDIYMDDDYDDERYKTDPDYADGVDDAMDEFEEDW